MPMMSGGGLNLAYEFYAERDNMADALMAKWEREAIEGGAGTGQRKEKSE
jgi:hypothetical protein